MSLLNNSITVNHEAVILCDDEKLIKSLSYNEMIHFRDQLTSMLQRSIHEKNICVGLLMDHNIYIPSIILSLHDLKHAFIFLTLKDLHKSMAFLKCNWMMSLDDINNEKMPFFQEEIRVLLADQNLILWKRKNAEQTHLNFQNIFCVVQTSGSTGEAKFVRVTNNCIQTNASNLKTIFEIDSRAFIFWGTNLTFDPSLIELLLALYSGACLVIVPRKVFINPSALYKALFEVTSITFLQMVPSVFLRWHEKAIRQILLNPNLQILAFGGEHFPKNILSLAKRNDLRIFNLYGITEVSCWATIYEIDENETGDIPIGKNLENTKIEVRTEFGEIVGQGKGEIFIGSSDRICYINEELTELSSFVYRDTGDIAEVTDKGIFILGRKNKVIKRFGHKINLTKLENNIFEITGLENRCIWSQEYKKILTFILMKNLAVNIKDKILDKLRIKLINTLPDRSFPDFIEIVTNFPLTCHGKINEKALESLYITTSRSPLTFGEIFSLLWSKYTGVCREDLGELRHCKFLEVGGNSISALQLLNEFKEIANSEFEHDELVTMIFESSYQDFEKYLGNSKPQKKSKTNNDTHVAKKRKLNEDFLKILWSHDLKACVDSTPVVFEEGNTIYIAVGSFSHKFKIFLENGQIVFEMLLSGSIESTPSISPCQNVILVGCSNGIMYCLDFLKKRIKWEFVTKDEIKCAACFCKNQTAVFGSYDKTIYCVSIMDGSKIWSNFLDGSIRSNPIYSDDQKCIYSATTKGTCFCLQSCDGKIIWSHKCSGPIFGTPCFVNSNKNIVFPTVQGVLYCLQIDNGDLLWKYHTNGYIFSSLVPYKSFILFGCHDKTVNILNISLTGCNIFNKIAMESEISTTPLVCEISGKQMVVTASNVGLISVINFETFELLGSIHLPGEVFSSPVVHYNKIYVGCRDNNFYCIEINI